jgi:Zn-finger nucleic acid-binding protein
MTCPKCQSELRERERETASGVVVMDVCPGCGGVWLDRGELDQLAQSESRYYDDRRQNRNDDDDDEGGLGGFLGRLFNMGD